LAGPLELFLHASDAPLQVIDLHAERLPFFSQERDLAERLRAQPSLERGLLSQMPLLILTIAEAIRLEPVKIIAKSAKLVLEAVALRLQAGIVFSQANELGLRERGVLTQAIELGLHPGRVLTQAIAFGPECGHLTVGFWRLIFAMGLGSLVEQFRGGKRRGMTGLDALKTVSVDL
jgi:hypothetical protein